MPPQSTLDPKDARVPPPDNAEHPAVTSNPNPSTTTTPSGTSGSLTAQAPPVEKKTPIYERWWLWTAVGGVVAVGLGVGLGIGLSSSAGPPTFPRVSF